MIKPGDIILGTNESKTCWFVSQLNKDMVENWAISGTPTGLCSLSMLRSVSDLVNNYNFTVVKATPYNIVNSLLNLGEEVI